MPRDVPHSYLVRSERARALVTYAPAGVEQFFIEMGLPVTDPDQPPAPVVPDHDAFAREMGRYGVELVGPPPTLERVAMATLLTHRMGPSRGLDRRWWTLIAVCGSTFMLLVDIFIVQVALPTIHRRLGGELHRPAVGDRCICADAGGVHPDVRVVGRPVRPQGRVRRRSRRVHVSRRCCAARRTARRF